MMPFAVPSVKTSSTVTVTSTPVSVVSPVNSPLEAGSTPHFAMEMTSAVVVEEDNETKI